MPQILIIKPKPMNLYVKVDTHAYHDLNDRFSFQHIQCQSFCKKLLKLILFNELSCKENDSSFVRFFFQFSALQEMHTKNFKAIKQKMIQLL